MDTYLLPCPLKSLTGFDCPGCGFQRALLELFQGNFSESFHHYPPLIPILITFIFLGVALKWDFKYRIRLLMGSFIFSLVCIWLNYGLKFL